MGGYIRTQPYTTGTLGRDEVSTLYRKLGIRLSKKKLKLAMAEMDPDGDGNISFDEFRRWCSLTLPPYNRCFRNHALLRFTYIFDNLITL